MVDSFSTPVLNASTMFVLQRSLLYDSKDIIKAMVVAFSLTWPTAMQISLE